MKKTLVHSLLITLLGLTSFESFAGTENYAGSECVRRSGGAIGYSFDGAIFNTSSTLTANVLCHIPHTDFDGFLHDGAIEGGWVDTIDLNSSRAISCRFRGSFLQANGSITRTSSQLRSTSGFGTQRRRLGMTSVGESAGTSYVLSCSIPPRTSSGSSKIHGYQVRQ